MEHSTLLQSAISIAKEAGALLRTEVKKQQTISYKNVEETDLVTETDKASEELICKRIQELFPDHGILGEEGGTRKEPSGESEYLWIIDPIDGTRNFAHGYPFFAVSIGITKNDQTHIGVVYNPIYDELFYAERGKGAYLNDEQIHVSKNPFKYAMLATGFPPHHHERNLKYFKQLIEGGNSVRRDGAASLDLCYTACGRLDGFWEFGLHPWDVAGGAIIVEEAGGTITSCDGSPLDLYARNVLCTNTLIHERMVEMLRTQ